MIFAFSQTPGLRALQGEKGCLRCNPAGLPNLYTIYHVSENRLEEIPDTSPRVRYTREETADGCRWRAEIDGVMEAWIGMEAQAGELTLRWDVTREGADRHLVSLRLEGLAAACGSDPHARAALPSHGGRLISPNETGDGQTDHRYNWVLDSFGSCTVVYTRGFSAVLQNLSMDDMLTSRVGEKAGERYAQMGVLLRHRYTRQDPSYRRARPTVREDDAREKEYPSAADFMVPAGAVRLSLLEGESLPDESGWVPGARLIHDRLPGKRSDFYRGYLVYKIFVGSPSDGIKTTWKQALEIIRQVYERTGVKQLVYLVGFQNKGHDDRYPDVFHLNTDAGPEEDFLRLIQTAREKYHALVSFHDNYDDAYRESPEFDENVIARDQQGHLLRGGVWNGKQAYWISLPQYAREEAGKRMRRTLEKYPFLRDSYHLDVLTASVFRLDFRADDPAGRQRDLEARISVVDQFSRLGLDVSSESCGLPFVGAISYFWHMQRVPRELYPGDRRIPMIPFLVHGRADYAGTHTDHPSQMLDGLLYGGFFCNDITADTPIRTLVDAAVMLLMPLDRLRDDTAVRYEEKNGWKKVCYQSGAQIAVNFESLESRVEIGGRRLIENGTAMIDRPDGTVLLYVSWEEPYTPVRMPCALPAGATVLARPLNGEGEEKTLTVDENGLCVDLPEGTVYVARLEETPAAR